jgi:hypothetical protein
VVALNFSEFRMPSSNKYDLGYLQLLKHKILNKTSPLFLINDGKHSVLQTCKKKKLHGLSPRANYTDRGTAACRRSDCQLVRIEDATWSA